ncbi:hypothetical protein KMW28_01415 [Flammeovirga yaeyamensis]|uniref:Uncharacterized protein n=2 Tax=Flammeovirga yaeyamensis TaxID=367791 RepID=A0AAX1N4B2_9BACT|nr:hypothetical protein [Flammeovirga yaeyamensis]MBB3699743.1 hypothetical protein [Flammeovirga yaeyamensis]QWG02269.1 hypothetical protein KMW28_01415 [Flammeovirga yaeyamensis]
MSIDTDYSRLLTSEVALYFLNKPNNKGCFQMEAAFFSSSKYHELVT